MRVYVEHVCCDEVMEMLFVAHSPYPQSYLCRRCGDCLEGGKPDEASYLFGHVIREVER